MVRSQRIFEIIEEENLVENARVQGEYLKDRLMKIQNDIPHLVSNTRGLGLMCSFDLPNAEIRNNFTKMCEKEKLLILGCGQKTVRFRPALNIKREYLDEGLNIIRKVLTLMASNN